MHSRKKPRGEESARHRTSRGTRRRHDNNAAVAGRRQRSATKLQDALPSDDLSGDVSVFRTPVGTGMRPSAAVCRRPVTQFPELPRVKALVKESPAVGFVLKDVPVPTIRDDEVLDPCPPRRRLRHRRSHLRLGRVGEGTLQAAVRGRPRVRRRRGAGRPPGHRREGRRPRHRRGPHRRRALPAVPNRQRARLPVHEDHRRRSRRLLRRVHLDAGDERLAPRRRHLLRRRRNPRPDGERVSHGAARPRFPATRCSSPAAARSESSRSASAGRRAPRESSRAT